MADVIFPTWIPDGTIDSSDLIMFADVSASNATKDATVASLPVSTATQTALDAKLDDSQLDTDGTLAANSDTKIASQKATKTYTDTWLATKQATLVSWTNIKTVNGNTLLGSGDLVISGTGTVTEVSSANADIGVATGTTTPVLTLNSGTGANQIVKLDGTAKLPAVDGSLLINLPSSGGDVVWPASSTDNAIARYDSTTGKLLQNSWVTIDDNNNVYTNNYFANITSTVSAGGTTVLTIASSKTQRLTGSSSQTFQLPDATTLPLSSIFEFDNNSSSSLIVTNPATTTLYTVPAGGAVQSQCTANGTANGTWDFHAMTPASVTWGSGITGLVMNSVLTTSPSVGSGASSSTAPSFIPQRGASTTGFGGDGTNLYATIAGTSKAKISSAWVTANTFIPSFTSTTSAAGTTTLTVDSTYIQSFVGSTTQTVVLPVASTLTTGHGFLIENNSSGLLTVNTSGGNTITTLAQFTQIKIWCKLASGTDGNSWNWSIYAVKAASGKVGTFSNTLTLAGTDGTTMTFPSTSATIARTDAANTFTGVQTMTAPVMSTPVINGLATGTWVSSSSTASTIVTRDANKNIFINNSIGDYTTTTTAAGTTTLTVGSTFQQFFTGSTTQTVTLPVTSTLTLGHTFFIVNNSTGAVTVNSSGANAVIILAAGTYAEVTCILTSGTTAASWNVEYHASVVTTAKKLSVSNILTLAGTDGTTMTFPSTSATIARTDAANTFTGVQTFSSTAVGTIDATNALKSATTTVNVSSATAPTAWQVLTATSSTAATWQTAGGGGFVELKLQDYAWPWIIGILGQYDATRAGTLTEVTIIADTLPVGSNLIGELRKNSTTSGNVLSTTLQVTTTESVTNWRYIGATPVTTFSSSAIADGDVFYVVLTGVGSTTAALNPRVILRYT